ncbi:asparaginase [Paeniglutamicibacter gangotriensis]|uniref:asparaginase n=1 Tax=Paeniglutamicibacter gangotriensis TaxID=254787 RepID=A0A5B0E3E7_9MICC|nr:asparaginase [Paeniglutamicibacter gangotriensis]KAA0973168.1 asparaginase [Paeniglutamicibacter gangotriensis]
MQSMPHVSVLATGGTIASSENDRGASVASRGAGDLLDGDAVGEASVASRDVMRLGSYLLGHRELRLICEAVAGELADGGVDGVVVTHGTDTMEETAYLLDLIHASSKPVVLTGAQRPADHACPDGPGNLQEAIAAAASPLARGKGTMISFAGNIYAARGTRKAHTVAPSPFQTMGGGPIGQVVDGQARFLSVPIRPKALALPPPAFDTTRVDIITVHPGSDDALARAAVEAGAHGIIIAGSGVGNGNSSILAWTEEAVQAGITVGLSTRVPEGPVVPFYGNGGGADLVRAGALPLGSLPIFQARMLLALLLSQGQTPNPEMLAVYV